MIGIIQNCSLKLMPIQTPIAKQELEIWLLASKKKTGKSTKVASKESSICRKSWLIFTSANEKGQKAAGKSEKKVTNFSMEPLYEIENWKVEP